LNKNSTALEKRLNEWAATPQNIERQ